MQVTEALFRRWWRGGGDRPGYGARLAATLEPEERGRVESWAAARWVNRAVRWRSATAWLVARLG